jgi:hypothetical protein
MASENSRRLQHALAPALKQAGFEKSGATWRKTNDDVVSVLNLQGSQWGPSFYVNLGVYFRALGDREAPCEADCHIRTRLDDLVPDPARDICLLDFEEPIQESVRFQELEVLIVGYGLPWLTKVSTVQGAREYCSTQHQKSPFVTKEAKALLGMVAEGA